MIDHATLRPKGVADKGERERDPRKRAYLLTFCSCLLALVLPLLLLPAAAHAADETELVDMSLEDLLSLEVTSVSRRSEKRTEAAAAIFVLTNEDIRRSGATTLPDLLRVIPGINVSSLTANTWSVTARGLGGVFANKLLVLIDGRTVYTPLFSGVYWNAQNPMLEDIDRIEVIRGPGGSLWGANAVNGVINIVTKSAHDTQGGLISLGAGSEEQAFGAFRFGGPLSDDATFRVYGKFFDRDDAGRSVTGADADDDWQGFQGGFRSDWWLSDRDSLTIQGDIMEVDLSQVATMPFLTAPLSRDIPLPASHNSRNILARWNRNNSDESNFQLQVYYDHYTRSDPSLTEKRDTFDIDFQHGLKLGQRHNLILGAAFRYTTDDIAPSNFFIYNDSSRSDDVISAFIQDEIALTESLRLIVGSKFEHNSYSGIEYQPNIRMAWTPNENHTVWGAISRAVRTPSRAEQDIHLISVVQPGPTVFSLDGRPDYESEDLTAFELGYRVAANDRVALDITGFFNLYDNYRSLEPGTPYIATNPAPTHAVVPFLAFNNSDARSFGIEAVLDYQVKKWWHLRATYAFLEIHLDVPAGDPVSNNFEGDTPEQQFTIQNFFDLPHNLELDTTFRFVDRLDSINVDDYVSLDIRAAWHPREDLELALVGQNLIDADRLEFSPTFVNTIPTRVQRGVYGKITWTF